MRGGTVPQCFLAMVMLKAKDELKLCHFTGCQAERCLFEPTPDYLRATAVSQSSALLMVMLPDFSEV